jgi:hypothetical protein
MKTKRNLTKVLTATALITAALFAACKKDDGQSSSMTQAEQQEFATNSSQSDAENDAVFDDVFNNVVGVNSEVGVGGTGIFARSAMPPVNGKETGEDSTAGFIVSVTQISEASRFPLKVVIDFGAGWTGKDGRIRKGKIIIVYSGRLILPGSSAATTFDGYYLDSIHVEGTHKATNTSTQDKRSFSIEVTGAKLSKPNGNYSTWNSQKTITQSAGLTTPLDLSDDVFAVTGKGDGSVKKGDKAYQWSAAITEPLVKKFTCRWISKGSITIQHNTTIVGVLDYGTGQCDRKATLTVNGVVIEITLD